MRDSIQSMQDFATAHEGFSHHYKGTPPWDTGRPQPPYTEWADRIHGPLLDAGCGTGSASVFFAERGEEVTGIDFVVEAVERARARAWDRGATAEFLQMDAMDLGGWDRRFRSVIDSGLFHVYFGRPELARYVQGLAHVLEPEGRLFLLTFTHEAREGGPSLGELAGAFVEGWEFESVQLVRGEVNPEFLAQLPGAYPDEGPKMWFAVIRRIGG